MAKIAFLGLGQMGFPMASRLLDAGHDLTVWNRTGDKASPLGARGARVAATPAEAAVAADATITMLMDADAVEDVLFGDDGAARTLGAEGLLIEMSTIGPQAVRSIAERVPKGVDVVDAPVRGSVPQATDGSLIVLVGATDAAFDRARPVLEPLGSVHRMGEPGSGAAAKLVANSTIGAVMTAFGEALALGDALGIDRSILFDMLADTPIGTTVRSKRHHVESGEYPANFKLSLALKDMQLVTDAADAHGRDLGVARAAREWFRAAVDAGAGEEDYSAVVATITASRR